MNLGFSVQFIDNCLGNNENKELSANNNGASNFLENLNSMSEEFELGKSDVKFKMNEEDVDYNVIEYILNTILQIKDIEDIENISDLSDIKLDDEFLKKGLTQEKLVDCFQKNRQTTDELTKEEIVVLNTITKIKKIDLEEILDDIEKLKSTTNKLGSNIEEKNDLVNEINSKIKIVKSYNELENNALINKSNVINKMETKDQELTTLEDIINADDNKFLTYLNSINAETSLDVGDTENQAPIRNIRQEFIGEDVVKTINYLKSNGLEEIKIKITPRELGEMTIKLIKNIEETKVQIVISNEDVFDLVNKNIGDIKNHLKSLDLNVNEISVDIKSDNEKLFSDDLNQEFDKKNQENKKNKNKYQNIETEKNDEVDEVNTLNNNLNILI